MHLGIVSSGRGYFNQTDRLKTQSIRRPCLNQANNPESGNRIVILDSLRGLAALIVLIHHAHVFFPETVLFIENKSGFAGWLWNLISNLNTEAVLFFFVLSGFSIALSSNRINWKTKEGINSYLYKRFKRILPLYWLTLIFSFLASLAGNYFSDPSVSFYHLTGNLLMLQTVKSISESWFVPFALNGPIWSIPYEMFYYLLFIPWMVFLGKLGSSFVKGLFPLSLAALLSLLAVWVQKTVFFPWIYFLNSFIVWYFGVFLFHLFEKKKKDDLLFVLLFTGLVCIEILAVFSTEYSLHQFSDTLFQIKNGVWIFVIFYFGYRLGLIFPAITETRIYTGVVDALKLLGDGSYAVYLLHYPVFLTISRLEYDSLPVLLFSSLLLITGCFFLERWLISFKWSFFKLNYLK